MTCNNDCNCAEEDDYEIQRLQDIIKICEFLIKHKKNKKHRDTLDKMLDDLDIQKEQEHKDDDNRTTRIVYQPIYCPPWQNGSQTWTWDKRKYPWYNNIWS